MTTHIAKFGIGQVVRHRTVPFRGVVFDVDPEYASSEERWLSIPANERPRKDQPFYHLLAECADENYVAYVSEQSLVPDESGMPVAHPEADYLFAGFDHGAYLPRARAMN
jgi:heat shock protein HspQ